MLGCPRHWPKRVGATVDILYSDTGRVRKKYDSSTEGRSVTISPSVKAGRCMCRKRMHVRSFNYRLEYLHGYRYTVYRNRFNGAFSVEVVV